ncbi:MAG: DoxX family protein [Flavobacteriales bacterium]|nr:DoxX family protein [Flavobacteriales bacterium]
MLNNDGSSGLRKWLLRLPNFFAAVILLQTLIFKFTDAPVSVYIFTELGMEPWGRYGSGVAELIAAVLLLVPRYSWMGAVLAMGIMAGAITSHLTALGIEVQGDGGTLFFLAWTVMVLSAFVLFKERKAALEFLGAVTGRSSVNH